MQMSVQQKCAMCVNSSKQQLAYSACKCFVLACKQNSAFYEIQIYMHIVCYQITHAGLTVP